MIRLEAWGGAKSVVEKVRGVCDSFKSQEAECGKKWREKRTVTKKKERIIESRHNKGKKKRLGKKQKRENWQ